MNQEYLIDDEIEEARRYKTLWIAIIFQAIKDFCNFEKHKKDINFRKKRYYGRKKRDYLESISFFSSKNFLKACETFNLDHDYIVNNKQKIFDQIIYQKLKVSKRKKNEKI